MSRKVFDLITSTGGAVVVVVLLVARGASHSRQRRSRRPPGPLPPFLMNPVNEERLVMHLLAEHRRGQRIEDILHDPYIVKRTTEEQRARLLDRPEVIRDRLALKQGERRLSFGQVGGNEVEAAHASVGPADEDEPHPPEAARVRGRGAKPAVGGEFARARRVHALPARKRDWLASSRNRWEGRRRARLRKTRPLGQPSSICAHIRQRSSLPAIFSGRPLRGVGSAGNRAQAAH